MSVIGVVASGIIAIGFIAYGTRRDVVIISLMVLGMYLVDKIF